ncbi:hypothetical protein GTB71_004831 [Salmonella enterica]|nr:hypothetical protein [Salmonella enterica]EHI9032212.1 hypothetical protein [Salmonella enterica subsp. enterica serovar Newport]MBJ3095240.1 hypothetical protein [Salmonella enterica subsp. enterica serovar Derby]
MLRDFLKEKEIGGIQYVFVYPNIPKNKVDNFSKYFSNGFLSQEKVCLFLDDTVFGSGKEGVLFTENYLCRKRIFEPSLSLLISDIIRMECKGRSLYVNGDCFYKFSTVSGKDLQHIVNVMNEWIGEEKAQKLLGSINNVSDIEMNCAPRKEDSDERQPIVADMLIKFLSSNNSFIVEWISKNFKERILDYIDSDDALNKLTFVIYGKMPSALMPFVKPEDVRNFIAKNKVDFLNAIGLCGETENRANVIAGQTAAIDVCKCDDNYSEENVENKKTKEIKRGEPENYELAFSLLRDDDSSVNNVLRFITKISLRHMWDVFNSSPFPPVYRVKYKLAYDFYNAISQILCSIDIDETDEAFELQMAASLAIFPVMVFASVVHIKDNYPITNDVLDLFIENVEVTLNACCCFYNNDSNREFFRQMSVSFVENALSRGNVLINEFIDAGVKGISITREDLDLLCSEAIYATDEWIDAISKIELSENKGYIYGWRELLCTSPLDAFIG